MMEQIFCLQAFIITFAVAGLLMIFNRTLTSFYPKWEKNRIIKKSQPLFPFVLAEIGAFIYPPDIATTLAQTLMWGLIPAMMSASSFKIFKTMFFEKFGIDVDEPIEKNPEEKK